MVTYVWRDGKCIDKSTVPPPLIKARSGLPAPGVISDIMDETLHMATGRTHTSKSEFRKDTKASGCIEYGSETSTLLKPREPAALDRKKRRDDIRKAIHELKNQPAKRRRRR